MIVIGGVALFALNYSLNDKLVVEQKLLFLLIGIAVMIAIYFVDYRKLLKYTWLLYGVTLLVMGTPLLSGTRLNGVAQWFKADDLGYNVYALSPYLLVISVSGILQGQKLEPSNIHGRLKRMIKNVAVLIIIPAILYVKADALSDFVIYGFSLAVLLMVIGKRLLLTAGFGAAAFLLWMLITLQPSQFHFRWMRITGFLNPNADALGSGFLTLRSMEAIQLGSMWGQGFGVVNRRLPYSYNELIYSYLVYSFGWVFGIAIAVLVLLFIVRIAHIGCSLQDSYAKKLMIGLTAVLGIQFGWNLLMCAGFMPITGIRLPILDWSPGTIAELAAVGLILGAYRRKDMIGSSTSLKNSSAIFRSPQSPWHDE